MPSHQKIGLVVDQLAGAYVGAIAGSFLVSDRVFFGLVLLAATVWLNCRVAHFRKGGQ